MALESWQIDLIEKLPQYELQYQKLRDLIDMIRSWDEEGEGAESDVQATQTPRHTIGTVRARAVRPDEFVGMSTSKAVVAFLTMKGKGNPQGPRDMAKAMVAGGRDSDEEKAYANVTSVLKRMNKSGEVKQVRRGQWGLGSWYGTSAPAKKAAPRPGANSEE